jgi:hypothetical protein
MNMFIKFLLAHCTNNYSVSILEVVYDSDTVPKHNFTACSVGWWLMVGADLF